jgi:hypothetical protein
MEGEQVKSCRGRAFSARLFGAVGLSACLGLAFLVPASASADFTFREIFGSAAQPSFSEAEGMAVSQPGGEVIVIDGVADTVSRYNPDGSPANFSALGSNVIDGKTGGADETPQNGLSFGSPGEVQVAVDNSGGPNDGNIYVPQASADVVDIFGEDGSFLGQLTKFKEGPAAEGPEVTFSEPCGVAVDPDGNLYVGDFSPSVGAIHKYEPAAEPAVNADSSANFPANSAVLATCTLAAGAGATDGFIFATRFFSGEVSKLNSTSGAEAYKFGSGATTVTVDEKTGHVFTPVGTELKEWDASGATEALEVPSAVSVSGAVRGIAVDGESGDLYIAHAGIAGIEVWGSALLPDATTEAASVIDGTVTLRGAVSAAGGPPATCEFEYVEASAKEFEGANTVPCTPAGPFVGEEPEAVSAVISGLAEAAYRFRLVASNEDGSSSGGTLFFNTFAQLDGLPDGRAYEMVSPPEKTGEVIPPEPAANIGESCDECLPGRNQATMPMQATPDGASVLYEGQPFSGGLAAGPNEYVGQRGSTEWSSQSLSSPITTGRYEAFSSDLSRGVLFQADPALSSEAPTRGEEAFPNLYLRDESGSFEPLITVEPPERDPFEFRIHYAGANSGTALTPEFNHQVFEANDALTEEVPGIAPEAPEIAVAGDECTFDECNLYEWVGGELRLVNVLPGNTSAASDAAIGAGRLLVETPQFEAPNVDHAISEDGSRVFWSTEETGQVYVRVGGEETLEVPGPESCKASVALENRACFLTASADGSSVLLSDGQVYELNEGGTAYVPTADLTEGQGGFEGILGASEDLSQIYFIDTADLTSGEENANDEEAEAGELNLYAWDEGSTFIGMLLDDDNGFGQNGRYGTWKAALQNRTTQVTPDGRHLAFMSQATLTGYDNEKSGGGECTVGLGPACFEVFVYAAGPDTLACASCNPSSEQPIGPSNLSLLRPGSPGIPYPPFPQPGNLPSDGEGRVFFESQDTLSPQDTNGDIQDVYEWEPNGIGSCKRAEGCVYLISSGHSANDSMFLDSTPSGNDAFFITREKLLPRDKDEQLDLYDARVGGGFEDTTAPPCNGEGCADPVSAPPSQTSASSAQFVGPPDPKSTRPCKKGFVKKKGKCVKKKPKRQKSKNRAARNRGGSK